MKTLLAMLVLVSSTAFAFGPDAPWDQIFKTKDLILIFEEPIGDLKLDNACMTDTEIRSIQDIKYCKELVPVQKGENRDRWTDWVCKEWVVGPYVYPRSFESNVCLEWKRDQDQNIYCSKTERQIVTTPQTIKVRVAKGYGTTTTYPGFQKLFTFPNCQ